MQPQGLSHPSTNQARPCLASEIRRDRARSGWRPGPLGTRGINHGDGKDRGSKSRRVNLGRKAHGPGTGAGKGRWPPLMKDVGQWGGKKWGLLLFGHSVTLCNPMDCSMPGFPVLHQLPELTQIHVHEVSDAIRPSHPLLSPSPPAFSLSQHQGLFK